LKRVKQALEALGQHNQKIKEVEYQRALRTLREERKQAFREGDAEKVLALEDKIDEIQEAKTQIVEQPAKVQVDDEYTAQFQSWVNKNPWYDTNKAMRAAADTIGKEYFEAGHSPSEVLELVEKEIKQEFAHKFKSPARQQAVESSSRQSGNTRDSFVMSPDEEQIMRKIVDTGIMTKAEYIAQLKATR